MYNGIYKIYGKTLTQKGKQIKRGKLRINMKPGIGIDHWT